MNVMEKVEALSIRPSIAREGTELYKRWEEHVETAWLVWQQYLDGLTNIDAAVNACDDANRYAIMQSVH